MLHRPLKSINDQAWFNLLVCYLFPAAVNFAPDYCGKDSLKWIIFYSHKCLFWTNTLFTHGICFYKYWVSEAFFVGYATNLSFHDLKTIIIDHSLSKKKGIPRKCLFQMNVLHKAQRVN